MMVIWIFYFFVALAASSALGIVFSRNVFKSALLLLISLLSVAAVYVLSFAEFLAMTQIMIYAGGILVVIIFGIMLTTKISGQPLVVDNTNIFWGGLTGIVLVYILIRYLPGGSALQPNDLAAENISTLGLRIFVDYTLPFEVAGLLLLIALIGAAVVTSHLKSKVS
ncbi:MAG: NADH-quinone oxidoreductase subunit J [Cyclobacteriaceae bacterium]